MKSIWIIYELLLYLLYIFFWYADPQTTNGLLAVTDGKIFFKIWFSKIKFSGIVISF